jgi:hypothetical protein
VKKYISVCIVILAGAALPASGTPLHVSIDVSSLGLGSDLELEFALYDNSGVVGDSWALVDNVSLGGDRVDFEDGLTGGFDDGLNPDTVEVVAGSLDGAGLMVMRIDEDASVTPTLTFRVFTNSSATSLEFDFEFSTGDVAGVFGLDQFVVSLLDPATGDALLPALSEGLGDVLAVDFDGLAHTPEVTVIVIPEPGALFVFVVIVGGTRLARRARTGRKRVLTR